MPKHTHPLSLLLRRVLLTLGTLACLLGAPATLTLLPRAASADLPPAASVDSQETPSDVRPLKHAANVKLGAIPRGFVEHTVHSVRWAYPSSAEDKVRVLIDAHPALWNRVTSELRPNVSPELTVRVARSPEEMARLAPVGSPPPAYAVGVAYPQLGLVLLTLVTPDSWLLPDLESVYTHELSHVALHRAVNGQPVPRWLAEGLAIFQAKEQNMTRVRTLWEASVRGTLLPLSELSRRFPSRPHQVNVAYAQSGDFVAHMLGSPDDRARFRSVIKDVAGGRGFDDAVSDAYYVPPEGLEREWRANLSERFTGTPLLLTGTAIWGLVAFLLVWAFVAKRRRDGRELARWAVREASEARAAKLAREALEARPLVLLGPSDRPKPTAPARGELDAAEYPAVHVHTPAMGVPTVEDEGSHHTLH